MAQQIYRLSDRFYESWVLLPDWFTKHVKRPSKNGCWPWSGPLTPEGYAKGPRGRPAERWSYELHLGPVPPGRLVRWACDGAPRCMNPRHLKLERRS